MSSTKKALVIWLGVGAVLVLTFLMYWKFDGRWPTSPLNDLFVPAVLLVIWGYMLNRLATIHRNSKSEGAAK